MNRHTLTILLLAAALPAFSAPPPPALTLAGTYDTGLEGAEIISVRQKDNLGAITIASGSVDLLDLSNPSNITRICRITVPAAYGGPNSVAIHPSRDYILVAAGEAGKTGYVIAYRISDCKGTTFTELDRRSVGIQPDSVAITENGRYAVVANEAEGIENSNPKDNGGEGSISVIELENFLPHRPSALHVYHVPLPSAAGVPGFSTGRTDDLARIAIDNTPATLEPESIAFSQNHQLAYITMQENNGVAVLDLRTRVISYIGLGQVSHLADLSTSGGYNPVSTLTAFREPDGIALFKGKGGIEYFVTADEGDTRNAAGSGSVRGGRSVSVFNAKTGALLGDTGAQLDDAAAAAGVYDDSRSNRGGSEPETLDVASYKGRDLVAVGLERASAVALVDVSEPSSPAVISLGIAGSRPEGVKFFKTKGKLYVLAANEQGGVNSLTAFLVE